ncbi:MAG: A/G-specific adenine glycosylase [Candidatus Schekmanbacteria bacterium]|nr:A/G-specific adenine glycosylase [Candidatus Schekmanbacteria bacterium]
MTDDTAPAWAAALVSWYRSSHRDLPWRRDPSPYAVWVSEIMLQQTRVDTVVGYFARFMDRFPTLSALAEADVGEVLRLWEGLGYYARGRNLHKAARRVAAELGGSLPSSAAALAELPGIGSYTGAAIASLAFGERIPVVDGNVLRVFTRFWGIFADVRTLQVKADLAARLSPVLAGVDPRDFNQAVMELGALVCSPKSPSCLTCPLIASCRAYACGWVAELPVRGRRAARPCHEVAVAAVVRSGRVLLSRRPDGGMLGGLWELPGGKCHGRSPSVAVVDKVREETGLVVTVRFKLCQLAHAYTHFRIALHAFVCEPETGEASALRGDEVRWCAPAELGTVAVARTTRQVLDALVASRWFR